MIVLRILLASFHPSDALPLTRVIEGKLDQKIPGVEIHVEVVSTIREVRERAHTANVIMLHLTLSDAGQDEVISAIPELPEPVLVFTKNTDADIHARCKMAGALVLVEGETRHTELCSSLLHCLGRSVMNAMKTLP